MPIAGVRGCRSDCRIRRSGSRLLAEHDKATLGAPDERMFDRLEAVRRDDDVVPRASPLPIDVATLNALDEES